MAPTLLFITGGETQWLIYFLVICDVMMSIIRPNQGVFMYLFDIIKYALGSRVTWVLTSAVSWFPKVILGVLEVQFQLTKPFSATLERVKLDLMVYLMIWKHQKLNFLEDGNEKGNSISGLPDQMPTPIFIFFQNIGHRLLRENKRITKNCLRIAL